MNLTIEQKSKITAVFRTSAGNPTIVATPTWTSSDESVISLVVAENGLEAYAVAENPGSATVTVSANADLKGGNRIITGSVSFVVENAEAQTVDLLVSSPELK